MLFESAKQYFWGIIRRVWVWLPAFLLDPFDIFNRFINPILPDSIRQTKPLDLPSELFPWALNVLLLFAGLLTYHELRKEKFLVKSQASERLIKQTSIDTVAELRESGNTDLFNRKVSTASEFNKLQQDHEEWWKKVVAHLENDFSKADAIGFKNLGSISAADFIGSFSPQHNILRGQINKRLEILQKIIDRDSH